MMRKMRETGADGDGADQGFPDRAIGVRWSRSGPTKVERRRRREEKRIERLEIRRGRRL